MTISLTSISPDVAAINTPTELAIIGSEFTKTTTLLYVGDDQHPFDWVSDTAIKAVIESAVTGPVDITVEKGGTTAGPLTVTFVESMDMPDDTVIPGAPIVPPADTPNVGAGAYMTEQEKQALLGNTGPADPAVPPGPPATTTAELGITAATPYPTGGANPDPKAEEAAKVAVDRS